MQAKNIWCVFGERPPFSNSSSMCGRGLNIMFEPKGSCSTLYPIRSKPIRGEPKPRVTMVTFFWIVTGLLIAWVVMYLSLLLVWVKDQDVVCGFCHQSDAYFCFSCQHRYTQAKLNISDRAAKVRIAFFSFRLYHVPDFLVRVSHRLLVNEKWSHLILR